MKKIPSVSELAQLARKLKRDFMEVKETRYDRRYGMRENITLVSKNQYCGYRKTPDKAARRRATRAFLKVLA